MKLTGNRCRCSGCGEHFNSAKTFDGHRVGPFAPISLANTRRCLTGTEMRAKGWLRNAAGFWISAKRPAGTVADAAGAAIRLSGYWLASHSSPAPLANPGNDQPDGSNGGQECTGGMDRRIGLCVRENGETQDPGKQTEERKQNRVCHDPVPTSNTSFGRDQSSPERYWLAAEVIAATVPLRDTAYASDTP
jgi:hypothetical protein